MMIRIKNKHTIVVTLAVVFGFFLFVFFFACEKFEPERIIKIKTNEITNISYTSCSAQGTILDIGSKGIDQHGFCWGQNNNPTITGNKSELGSKNTSGSFSATLNSLMPGKTYYIRAYAKNKDMIVYGDQKSFTTLANSLPILTTTSINNIKVNSAQSGGNITSDGGAAVTARGVCWSTSQNPTIADAHTIDGSGTGSFTSTLTGLTQNTTYYVRAYATNSIGTAYGNEVSFKTNQSLTLPSLTTASITNISDNSAQSGGNITSDGGAAVTARGVCWSTSQNPTLADTYTIDGSGMGSYSSSITGLSAGTTYHVRAYATNAVGTAYGYDLTFTTITSTTTVTDYDGNVYQTVIVGTQTWMAENLKTTKYNDGTAIPLVTDNTTWSNLTTPGYCWYNNDEAGYKNTYGALYNWHTVSTGKLCPTGWHVPTDAEWTTLTDYLGGESVAGGKLKETGTTHWLSPNTGATNETGFTALPGGYRSGNGAFSYVGGGGDWWSATEYDASDAWLRGMTYDTSDVGRYDYGEKYGFSVRCVRDY